VVVFFGPEIPGRYRPLTSSLDAIHTGYSCSPCIGPHNQRQSPCNDNVCLRSISIDEITQLVRARLATASSSRLLPSMVRAGRDTASDAKGKSHDVTRQSWVH
jgi:hypothetical protein